MSRTRMWTLLAGLAGVVLIIGALAGPAWATGAPPGPPDQTPPCQIVWCQRTIQHFCHRFDCGAHAAAFRGTAVEGLARKRIESQPRSERDLAFQPPWNGAGFEVHHIVAKGRNRVAQFAQSILALVGVAADDLANLAALRGFQRQRGKPGYTSLPPALQRRMAHSDTRTNYYAQQVNERFAAWVDTLHGRSPDTTDRVAVELILAAIRNELYRGGKSFIAPGRHPRAADFASG